MIQEASGALDTGRHVEGTSGLFFCVVRERAARAVELHSADARCPVPSPAGRQARGPLCPHRDAPVVCGEKAKVSACFSYPPSQGSVSVPAHKVQGRQYRMGQSKERTFIPRFKV